MELKGNIINEIQTHVDNFARLFVFSVQNMRNSKLKDVRQQWRQSRFFFGKNKVMAKALGRNKEDEYGDNLHKISSRLRGHCGLMFTNNTKDEVLKWFNEYVETDFARSGNIATETVVLDKGPINQFPHSLEPHLRQLGLQTSLQRGVITLVKDHEVCKEGDVLTSEQTRILKLLGNEMSQFRITIEAMRSNDGTYEEFISTEDTTEGNDHSLLLNKRTKKSNSMKNVNEDSEDIMTSDESD